MRSLFDLIRNRIAPAMLTAAGIALIGAGLLTFSLPVDAGPPDASDGAAQGTPAPLPTFALLTIPPLPSPASSVAPSSVSPSPTPAPGNRVATRVVVPALDIDLPIVKAPAGFPYCDVAMYLVDRDLPNLSQPGLPGATYVIAHARTGMFLPLLTQSQHNNGTAMLGMVVQVYTSDDQLFIYQITQVRRHYPWDASLSALPTKDDQLWLQTSEGPLESSTKLQVVAQLLSSGPADPAQAHPKAKPRVCA
jgi:hypothetical protein